MSVATRGTAPLSMPATADETHCSAIGNSIIGAANHTKPSTITRGRSTRSTLVRRARGTSVRAPKPKRRRPKATTPGSSVSRPSAMSRNDDPHTTAATATNVQSNGSKAAELCPSAVTGRRSRGASGTRSAAVSVTASSPDAASSRITATSTTVEPRRRGHRHGIRRCERVSASERAASTGLRGRGTQ